MSHPEKTPAVGPKEVVYARDYGRFHVECYALTQHKVLVYAMRGFIEDRYIQAYIDDLLRAVRERKPTAMIADPREMSVLSPTFRAAIQAQFWPEIAYLGVKRNPAIDPSSPITNFSVSAMVDEVDRKVSTPKGDLKIAVLPTLELCLAWALQQE